MVTLRDGFFYPTRTRIMDSFSCSPLFLFIIPEFPEYAKIQFHMMTLLAMLCKIAGVN